MSGEGGREGGEREEGGERRKGGRLARAPRASATYLEIYSVLEGGEEGRGVDVECTVWWTWGGKRGIGVRVVVDT